MAFGCNASSSGDRVESGTDVFATSSGKAVSFTFIKHASVMIQYDTLTIYVDPVEALPPETDFGTYPKADIILVTHEHFDHFDSIAIGTLSDSNTVIISNAAVRAMLKQGTALANGGSVRLRSDILVEAVPAYNTTPANSRFHPKGRDNGYVITLDDLRIYLAGDTEDIPEMNDLQNIDVAFLPCNQPYTMTLDQLAAAARMVRPKVFYPYHYNDTPVERVVNMLSEEHDIDVRIRPMK